MKKIAAVALCICMVLSACAVAYAGSTTTESKGRTVSSVSGYYMREIDSNKVDWDVENHATTGWYKYTEDDETTTYWYPEYYEDENGDFWYVCDSSVAEARVFNSSGLVCYVLQIDEDDLDERVEEGVLVDAGDDCMDYEEDTVEIGDEAYEVDEDGDEIVYADGVVVKYSSADESKVYKHQFDIEDVTFKGTDIDGHKVPVSVTCSECGKTFQIVEKTKLGAYEGKYEKIHYNNSDAVYAAFYDFDDDELASYHGAYYVLLGSDGKTVTTTTTTSDGVESAKTFDAGIAMYVGMSLSAVAGSAVVIGKKKEF